jgi:hypothetical protein
MNVFNELKPARKAQLNIYDSSKAAKKYACDMCEPVWYCELKSRLCSVPYVTGDGPKFVCAAEICEISATVLCSLLAVNDIFHSNMQFIMLLLIVRSIHLI